MKKTPALRELKKYYDQFWKNILVALHFQTDIPKSLTYFKLETELIHQEMKNSGKFDIDELLDDHLEKTHIIKSYPAIVYSMSVVNIVAHFEAFIQHSLRLWLLVNWRVLITTNKTMTYEEILYSSSIEEIVDRIVSKEIYEVGYKSIKDQFEYFNSKFKFNIHDPDAKRNRGSIEMDSLTELFSTRNLILHSNSVISELYLKNNPRTEMKIGENRNVDQNYVMESIGIAIRNAGTIYDKFYKSIKAFKTRESN